MDIKGPNYRVWFDPANTTVSFEGSLRLGSVEDYQPIEDLMGKVLDANPSGFGLDMRGLNFLNSSGINVLYKFAMATRSRGELRLVVQGSKSIPWQVKALPNLKEFNSNVDVTLYD